ncbi:MAG: hypothetical protein O8C61_09965 [Candidatus Methanoperedens sp.]|nr:hypothetical protein [Candidatus Methanoperedens sp.]
MESPFAFKLVVSIPSFLFLIGFFLKGILEGSNLKKIFLFQSNLESNPDSVKEDLKRIFENFYNDFYYVFSIESLFLLVVNGLIFIFQFDKLEFGVLLIIISLIIFLLTSIGSHLGNWILTAFGIWLTMIILGIELGYFLFNDIAPILGQPIHTIILFTILFCLAIASIVIFSFLGISRNLSLSEIFSKKKNKL